MTRLGASPTPDGAAEFLLWGSKATAATLVLDDGREVAMEPRPDSYFHAVADDAAPGTRYRYRVRLRDGAEEELADPASRSQPDGVHGPSAVVDPRFGWTDHHWHGLPLRDFVVYELHVGTFTAEGTFDAAIARLDDLVDLGVTAVEVMPVAEFPGGRNWGYDGVFPFAAQSTYGGPDGFRRLVDACHSRGLAVVLDVVYNHFGPEGATAPQVSDYFTDRYTTPWGAAVNFDGPGSDGVRRYVVDNALWWVDDCHVDALRLDAVHAILDRSARHVLAELADAVHDLALARNRRIHVIAESDLNDPRLVRASEIGGYGLDGQWSDDFHHSVHAMLTGEEGGYYADFGSVDDLAAALRGAYVFVGQRSHHRGHRHGAAPDGVPAERFVVCAQNHDQVGNRMNGERLASLVGPAALKVAAAAVCLSPYVPLLFMGEEYGETAPFLYFISHTDPDLVAAVRRGRKEEFAAFRWAGEPPDPQDPETFRRCVLDHASKVRDGHAELLAYHRELLRLRRDVPALRQLSRDHLAVHADGLAGVVAWHRWVGTDPGGEAVVVAANLRDVPATTSLRLPAGRWRRVLDSTDPRWGAPRDARRAPGSLEVDDYVTLALDAYAAAVYVREKE